MVGGGMVIGKDLLAACGSDSGDKSDGENTSTNVVDETNEAPSGGVGSGEYRTLSIDEFADIVENRANEYQIINVHIPYAGEVENTDANIPYHDLDALTAAIPSKDTPVILYCRSGNMSEQASRALVEQGYTQIWDVPGGMAALQTSGRELVNK
jgi:rhodanese-related sulfurtransferase